jgi:hypothetical protein
MAETTSTARARPILPAAILLLAAARVAGQPVDITFEAPE